MWTREEGLSEIKVAEFVDLPEKKAAAAFTQEEDETFVERLTRQLVDAKVSIHILYYFGALLTYYRISPLTSLPLQNALQQVHMRQQ